MNHLFCILCISVLMVPFYADAKRRHSYDCDTKIAKAFESYHLGKYSKVKTILEEAKINCNGKPNMDSVYFYLGMSYLKTKMYIEARSELERVVSDYPDSPLFFEAKFRAATAVYLQAHPSNRDQKETVEAIELFRTILEEYPSCPVSDSVIHYLNTATDKLAEKEYNNARFYEKQGQYESAVVYYNAFIKQYPDSKYVDEAKFTMAGLLVKLERKSEAAEIIFDIVETCKNPMIVTKAKDLQKKVQ